MRLWHQSILSKLPRKQLLGQHREICALRGNGWNKKHSVVNYIFNYSPAKLVSYHYLVMEEMINRGYNVTEEWLDYNYRGKECKPYDFIDHIDVGELIYPEHDGEYLKECIDNLKGKGIKIAG